MARKQNKWISWLLGIAWLLATVSIGSAMIAGSLTVPILPGVVGTIAGWLVVIMGVVGLAGGAFALIKK